MRKFGLAAGGVTRLNKMRVAEVPQRWLRRALNGVHQLLKAGQLKALGDVVGPDMSDGSYSVQLCCQALTGGDEHTQVRTAPWCMACTCSWMGYWCPHLVMDALLRAAARNPGVADGPTPAMFLLPRGDSGPPLMQLARAPAARAPAARTPAPAGDMDAQLLEVVASTAATLAMLGEAGQRGRAAPAAWDELLSLVRRTFQAAQALVRDPEEGGGGRTRRSDRTKTTEDADRARGSEKRLRAPSPFAHAVLASLLQRASPELPHVPALLRDLQSALARTQAAAEEAARRLELAAAAQTREGGGGEGGEEKGEGGVSGGEKEGEGSVSAAARAADAAATAAAAAVASPAKKQRVGVAQGVGRELEFGEGGQGEGEGGGEGEGMHAS